MTIPYADYKRIPEKQWLGQRVRLVKGITTNGATEFPAGTEAEIVRKYQGFELRSDACRYCGVRVRLKRVPPGWLELVKPS